MIRNRAICQNEQSLPASPLHVAPSIGMLMQPLCLLGVSQALLFPTASMYPALDPSCV